MWLRLVMGLFLPAVIGGVVAALPFMVTSFFGIIFIIFTIPIGFILISPQSLLYTLIMEFIVNRKVKSDRAAIGLSTLLGIIIGASLYILIGLLGEYAGAQAFSTSSFSIFTDGVIGAIAGYFAGKILRKNYNNNLILSQNT